MKISFLLPDNFISGGIFVAFEHAKRLASKGHHVTLIFEYPTADLDIVNYPGMASVQTRRLDDIGTDEVFDIAIATWWETVYAVGRIRAHRYAYLVQGMEGTFYPKPFRTYSLLVAETLREKNLVFFAVSNPLVDLIQSYGNPATLLPNTIDFDAFGEQRAAYPRTPGKLRVLIEGAAGNSIKNVPLMFAAVAAMPEVEVFYLGCDELGIDPAWRIDRKFIRRPHAEVPGIYASCDVLLKLSTQESFALPVLEMFASGGTAIVSAFAGHDQYIQDGKNALVVPLNDAPAATAALRSLVNDPNRLVKLRKGAQETCKSFVTWEDSSRILESRLMDALGATKFGQGPALPTIEKARAAFDDYKWAIGEIRALSAVYEQARDSLNQLNRDLEHWGPLLPALRSTSTRRIVRFMRLPFRAARRLIRWAAARYHSR